LKSGIGACQYGYSHMVAKTFLIHIVLKFYHGTHTFNKRKKMMIICDNHHSEPVCFSICDLKYPYLAILICNRYIFAFEQAIWLQSSLV